MPSGGLERLYPSIQTHVHSTSLTASSLDWVEFFVSRPHHHSTDTRHGPWTEWREQVAYKMQHSTPVNPSHPFQVQGIKGSHTVIHMHHDQHPKSRQILSQKWKTAHSNWEIFPALSSCCIHEEMAWNENIVGCYHIGLVTDMQRDHNRTLAHDLYWWLGFRAYLNSPS